MGFCRRPRQGYDSQIFEARSFNSVLLCQGETPELHADEPGLRTEIIATGRITSSNRPFIDIAETIRDRKITGKIALVGSDVVPIKYWRQMQTVAPEIDWQVEDDLVLSCWLIKSELEQEALRIGGATAARRLTRMMRRRPAISCGAGSTVRCSRATISIPAGPPSAATNQRRRKRRSSRRARASSRRSSSRSNRA
jgi:hypothetical protein